MRSTVHEMRNQLAVATANVEAFIDGKLDPTPDRLGAVLNALTKIDALMSRLKPRATIGPAQPAVMRPIDVCGLIASESVAMEASAAVAGITLDVDVCSRKHDACSHVMCDALGVSQVIENVVLNAIKYTGRGGRVKLYCHPEPGVLALEISDSGPGVRIEERQTIFERGVRGSAAASVAGSGVGLAITRGILDAHGGTISVADSPSGGAWFTIRLPDTADAAGCASCSEQSRHEYAAVTPVVRA